MDILFRKNVPFVLRPALLLRSFFSIFVLGFPIAGFSWAIMLPVRNSPECYLNTMCSKLFDYCFV